MTSEEKRRTSYQNGHGNSDQSTSLFSIVLDAFFLSLEFSQISHCKKIESRTINFHIYGNNGGGSLFSLILMEF